MEEVGDFCVCTVLAVIEPLSKTIRVRNVDFWISAAPALDVLAVWTKQIQLTR
jgi:hypothetical protein